MSNQPSTNRRDALKIMAAGMAGMAALPQSASAQPDPTPTNPAEALDALVKGNARYLKPELTSCSANFPVLRKRYENKQYPFAAILSCADSRVPAELIFDQTLGQLFVVRVAGNIAAPDTIASLEYAAADAKVKLILVVGHTDCGAVKAASANLPVPGQVSSLFQYIQPAVKGAPDLTEASRRNARLQASLLREASPVLAPLVRDGSLMIAAALYNALHGTITIL